MPSLLRASIKDSGIVVVSVHDIDGAVGLLGKRYIADKWPGRKMTLHICRKAIQLWSDAEKVANAGLGLDLVVSDPNFQFGRIAAITLHGAFCVKLPSNHELFSLNPALSAGAPLVKPNTPPVVAMMIYLNTG